MPKKRETAPPIENREIIVTQSLEEVMHDSMMPYAEYVILERALPRVEDGLKPVQRRILFSMHELSITHDKPHRKCARIVGDCLGKYHPHGDTSVYDALVRMAQVYSLRAPLVDGHGNFGSIDGDAAAAMRYTEARLTPLAAEMLRDLDKNTVPFRLNFDDSAMEPDMLPARFPNLLVNGASGIAVGLATNIPPHNLYETISAVIAQIDDPEITIAQLMQFMPAPDFPTGGILIDNGEIETAYQTGRGKLLLRAKIETEAAPSGRTLLAITEMPYGVAKAPMLEKIQKLREEKKYAPLAGIYDIRDESDRSGLRAVIELKRDVDTQRVLSCLYKYTDLQVTFGANMVAIAGGKPLTMNLREIIAHYIEHQRDIVCKRTQYDLNAAMAREHILEGLMRAVDQLDAIIALIRASKSPAQARAGLMETFAFSEAQAQAILDLRLQRLTGLEIAALKKELAEVKSQIKKLRHILGDDGALLEVIKSELSLIAQAYRDERRTQIVAPDTVETAAVVEALPQEETVVCITDAGFFKRMPLKSYEKAVEDPPKWVLKTLTGTKLSIFTRLGYCYSLSVDAITECKLKDRGTPPGGILPDFEVNDAILSIVQLSSDNMGELCFVTQMGTIKRTPIAECIARKAKYAVIALKDGDALIDVSPSQAGSVHALFSRLGNAIAFNNADIPVQGRTAQGVRGMTLNAGDALVSHIYLNETLEGEFLLMTDAGYAKRIFAFDIDTKTRGGKGSPCFSFLKNGGNGRTLIDAKHITQPVDIQVMQKSGINMFINSEVIRIEDKKSRGKPYLVTSGDDPVVTIAVKAQES